MFTMIQYAAKYTWYNVVHEYTTHWCSHKLHITDKQFTLTRYRDIWSVP